MPGTICTNCIKKEEEDWDISSDESKTEDDSSDVPELSDDMSE